MNELKYWKLRRKEEVAKLKELVGDLTREILVDLPEDDQAVVKALTDARAEAIRLIREGENPRYYDLARAAGLITKTPE